MLEVLLYSVSYVRYFNVTEMYLNSQCVCVCVCVCVCICNLFLAAWDLCWYVWALCSISGQGLLSSCSVQVSLVDLGALGTQASVVVGVVARWILLIQGSNHVPWTARRILYHIATREVLIYML